MPQWNIKFILGGGGRENFKRDSFDLKCIVLVPL